jgi:hypothetical protein
MAMAMEMEEMEEMPTKEEIRWIEERVRPCPVLSFTRERETREETKSVPEAKLDVSLAHIVSESTAPGALVHNGAADSQSAMERVVSMFRVDN